VQRKNMQMNMRPAPSKRLNALKQILLVLYNSLFGAI
jgi:hypothetical protein